MRSIIDHDLLREAVSIACNDAELVDKFQSGEMPMRDVVRCVSYATHRLMQRRIFDALFYDSQLQALTENLQEFAAFQENWGETSENVGR